MDLFFYFEALFHFAISRGQHLHTFISY